MNRDKFTIGEKVKCLIDKSIKNGGSAYISSIGKILTIKEIKYNKECNVYLFDEVIGGIYEYALISVTENRNNLINEILCTR